MTEQREDDLEALAAELKERRDHVAENWIPGRYPYTYTYACDYLRQNPDVVPEDVRKVPGGWDGVMNRADALLIISRWATMRGFSDQALAKVLADQYMTEERIKRDV